MSNSLFLNVVTQGFFQAHSEPIKLEILWVAKFYLHPIGLWQLETIKKKKAKNILFTKFVKQRHLQT